MLKGQRKVNIAGSASGASLLLLAFLLVNPLGSLSASALEASGDEANSVEAGESSAQAEVDEGRVGISFTPTEVSGEMTPTTEAGLTKQLEATATITIQNAEDYTIYIGAKTAGLVGVNSGETIESIKSATSYEDLAANSWGIYYGEGTSVPANATYLPAETSRGTQIESGGRTTSTLTKTYALGFAANINNQMPADTYENQITLSVVSSPLEITNDFGIATMQEMTSTICADATDLDNDGEISAQLEDTRDGKYYWVNKLADGKCWMTQNLDLDLDASTIPLTPATSDVSTNWTPGDAGKNPAYTETTVTSSTIYANDIGQRSWNLGDYRIINPTASNNCGTGKNNATDCTSQFTPYFTPSTSNGETEAHYILGNHYQWNAATAGTGESIKSGQASSSICPKGWKLPESNATTAGSFGGLISAGNIGTNVSKLTSSPYYFVRGGGVYQSTSLFNYAGHYGLYWSSTPVSNGTNTYYLNFNSTTTIGPSSNGGTRQSGFSIRCIAR